MMAGMSKAAGADPIIEERIRQRPQEKLKRPSFYVVVVHNDPFTPRSFVVDVLKRYFDKGEPEATRIMLLAHNYGVGAIEKYSRDVAESKANKVNEFCRTAGYPLFFSTEEE
jgi:ATP-dependent Clp protease adaptor protein ClpS